MPLYQQPNDSYEHEALRRPLTRHARLRDPMPPAGSFTCDLAPKDEADFIAKAKACGYEVKYIKPRFYKALHPDGWLVGLWTGYMENAYLVE